MESSAPPPDGAPNGSEPAAPETAAPETAAPETPHERHLRELEHDLEVLEETVEHAAVSALRRAIPVVIAVVVLAFVAYAIGRRLRDRAERRA